MFVVVVVGDGASGTIEGKAAFCCGDGWSTASLWWDIGVFSTQAWLDDASCVGDVEGKVGVASRIAVSTEAGTVRSWVVVGDDGTVCVDTTLGVGREGGWIGRGGRESFLYFTRAFDLGELGLHLGGCGSLLDASIGNNTNSGEDGNDDDDDDKFDEGEAGRRDSRRRRG